MKTPSLIPFIFSLALPAFAADPAYTAPVGYTTVGGIQTGYTAPTGFLSETLRSGMNLIGLRLHQSTIATGIIASIGSDFAELTCPDRSGSGPATPALISGTTYVLEITSGAKVGVIQEITRWQALRLTLSDDLAAAGVKPGLNLVASPFPSGAFLQDLGLADDLQKSDDPSEADRGWIAAGLSGQFNTYFLSAAGHWISTTDGEILAQKTPVGSAILIERIGPQALFCLGDSAK